MASICPYPGRKCAGCEHYRPDPDRDGEKSCFVTKDRPIKAFIANVHAAIMNTVRPNIKKVYRVVTDNLGPFRKNENVRIDAITPNATLCVTGADPESKRRYHFCDFAYFHACTRPLA